MDFQCLAEAPRITSIIQDRIKATLVEFHNHKDKITDKGLWRGAESGSALDHWFIPKLELMQSIAPSISELGMPVQWSADTMEHAHIKVIKEPASMTNHQNYDTQICCYLDCVKRCWLFEMATCLSALGDTNNTHDQDLAIEDDGAEDDESNMADNEDAMEILKDIWSSRQSVLDFFGIAERLRAALPGSIPHPVRMFSLGATALHISHWPSINCISIDKAAELFDIPDLRGALADYLSHEGPHAQNFHSFGRQWHSPPDAHLPFSDLQVWYKVHLQQKSYHDSSSLEPVFKINAHPPDRTWKYGCHDMAILQVDACHEWPASGLTGHTVVDVCLIMCPMSPRGLWLVWDDCLLVYVWQFDIVSQQQADVDLATGLHILKWATHALGEHLGDIFPLDQIKSYAHLVPHFGEAADNRFTSTNSFHSAQSFWLNSYFDKEFYYALSL
ncbi:hypothetical protein EV401DRAFT_2068993 [Pisolithus croceorrhizus]|nr:hypothetical protein EV401DRAFT_2068993 [Pisolithus croceorrhizus]